MLYFWFLMMFVVLGFIFYVIPRFVDDAWKERSKSKRRKGLVESDVFLSVITGKLSSINGIPELELSYGDGFYGCDAGQVNVELVLTYSQSEIRKETYETLALIFDAVKGNSYSINIVGVDPQEDPTVYYSTLINSDNFTFKKNYYFVVKDVSSSKKAFDLRRMK